jgi:DNA-binding NtrC family response regulator
LESVGYAVVLAESRQEALEVSPQAPYALALIDYQPPDSLTVVDALLRQQPSLRFIIITDYGIHDAMTIRTIRERVWSEGPSAVYFLAKPFEPLGNLMTLIQKALSESPPIPIMPPGTQPQAGEAAPPPVLFWENEYRYLVQVLMRTQGNVSRAAALAGLDRAELYRLLRKHNL